MEGVNITLPAENVVEVMGLGITNAVLGGFLVTIATMIIFGLALRKAGVVPSKLQLSFEMVITFFLDLLEGAYGSRKEALKWTPFYLSIFVFLIIANQFAVVPLVNSIILNREMPLFRTSTSDWSQTITLTLAVLIIAHLIALSKAPLKHIGNFIKVEPFLKIRKLSDIPGAIGSFLLGVSDIIAELAKVISLSARLFGNIFAGEVMVVVIAAISAYTTYLVPIPFIVLSVFSGIVQAFVFVVLSMQFMAGTIRSVD